MSEEVDLRALAHREVYGESQASMERRAQNATTDWLETMMLLAKTAPKEPGQERFRRRCEDYYAPELKRRGR